MNDLIYYLRNQNKCLERFLKTSRAYLSQLHEGQNDKKWIGIEALEVRRDLILKAFTLFESKARQVAESLRSRPIANDLTSEIWKIQSLRLKIIDDIKAVDTDIFTVLSQHAHKLQKDVRDLNRQKDTLSKFKSTWVPESGKEIDKNL